MSSAAAVGGRPALFLIGVSCRRCSLLAQSGRTLPQRVSFQWPWFHACHRSDLWPDFGGSSCMAAFNHSDKLPSFVTSDGAWHHLAVTWDATKDGLTQVGSGQWCAREGRPRATMRTTAALTQQR